MTPENPAGLPRVWQPQADEVSAGFSIRVLLDEWDAIRWDLHETFGIDLDNRPPLTWHGLVNRIEGLLRTPTRNYRPDGYPIPPNRLIAALTA